jgi:hypothetical protein
MATRNDITGDAIQTKGTSNSYRDNYDLIWGNKNKKKEDQKDEKTTDKRTDTTTSADS